MKRNIKILALILTACLCAVMLFACDANDTDISKPTTKQTEKATEAPTQKPTEAPTDESTEFSGPSKGLEFTSNGDGTCYVSGIGDCTDTDIVIPTVSPDGDSVTGIGWKAFYYCDSLTSITIPDSVTHIGVDAFAGCPSLIQMENDVSYVDKWVVDCDTSVTAVELRNDTVGIAYYAFRDCSSLTSITIPDSVTHIGVYAFNDCRSLTSITIPDSVTSIGDEAFYGCSNLSYNEKDGIKYLGNDTNLYVVAMDADTSIASVNLPDGIKIIYDSVFENCSFLTSINIPDGVTSIGDDAFYNCDSLTSINIPDSVTSIGNFAFSGCSSSESISIPDSVTSIGACAFSSCSSLTSITIPESVTSIGDSAFSGCYSLVEVYNKSSLTITAGSEKNGRVGYYALNVYTPTSGESKLHTTDDGYIFYVDGDTRYLVKYAGGETDITLPENCQGYNYEIYKYAFDGCSSLTSVTIPDSVASIGEFAFFDCDSLTSVTIGNSVTSIGSSAFSGCGSLVEVYNKSNLTITAGSWDNGRVGCYALNVYTPTSGESKLHTTDDGYVFYVDGDTRYLVKYVGGETDITLPENCQGYNYEIYEYAFYDCDSLTSVTISDSVTSIGDYAFYDCSSLTSITIPDSVTSIGYQVFSGCSSLTSITLPFVRTHFGYIFGASTYSDNNKHVPKSLKTVVVTGGTSIGEYAFSGCLSLTSITIPDSVTSIGEYAFDNCDSLTTINIPDGITSVGKKAFIYCNKLSYNEKDGIKYLGNETNPYVVAVYTYTSITSIDLPDGVKVIYGPAFESCTSLTSIIIPDSVTYIGYAALSHCTSLTSVTFKGTKEEWKAISKDSYWDYGTPDYIITCTDGTIAKDGTET